MPGRALNVSNEVRVDSCEKPRLYKTPIAVAWVLLIAGLLGAFNLRGFRCSPTVSTGWTAGFALTVVGVYRDHGSGRLLFTTGA
jgi:hypothetical protein